MFTVAIYFVLYCLFFPLVFGNTGNPGQSVFPLVSSEVYHEDMVVRPLPDGRVITSFTFTTILLGAVSRDPRDLQPPAQHYTLFPLTLGQVLWEYSITELHLALNSGKWNYDHWGYPDDPSVGSGAELWAWMAEGGPSTVDERWTGLRNALAGLFCASLGSLDSRRTSSSAPLLLSFAPTSLPHVLRYASLSSEHVCTENLSPFVKLLPCKSRAGLAQLLNPQLLFDADWHGLGIDVRSTEHGVELKLVVQAVFDPVRLSGGRRRDWSFGTLFNRIIDTVCPVASSSVVRVRIPADERYTLSPTSIVDEKSTVVYNLMTHVPLDISMSWSDEYTFQHPLPSQKPFTPLSIKRVLYGSSQIHGRLSLSITNNEDRDITVGYFENMPAFLTLWMHTMRVEVNNRKRDDLISHIMYYPHKQLTNGHSAPSTLQADLTVPGLTTVCISMEVSRAFLKYTEHPPDAMRGWDLPPAILFPVFRSANDVGGTNDMNASIQGRMYTPTLLVDLPTPDFSMPYNVIILSCTLITLIFGSIFNLMTRKWVIVQLES